VVEIPGGLRLSREAFDRATESIARPLDRGRWRLRSGDGSVTGLRSALEDYANDDGGYGHGIEPDLHLPASSPFATTVALQYLSAAGATAEWSEVQRATAYLVDTFDPALPGWEAVPPVVDDHPRAPWWAYRAPRGFEANPGVEILSYLYRYRPLVPDALVGDVELAAVRRLDELGSEIEEHELLCWLRLAAEAPNGLAVTVVSAARNATPNVITYDRNRWHEYVPGPLWVAPTPDAPLGDLVADRVDEHLDHLIESQRDDGAWAPTWTWGDDPFWPTACALWESPLTLHALETLAAYGRVEGR
jgi:hypothetical protein